MDGRMYDLPTARIQSAVVRTDVTTGSTTVSFDLFGEISRGSNPYDEKTTAPVLTVPAAN